MVEDRVIADHLTALLTPTITSQSRFFRELGLRERILTLPLMVAAVLTLLWRDVPGVTELTRLLEKEGFIYRSINSNTNSYYFVIQHYTDAVVIFPITLLDATN